MTGMDLTRLQYFVAVAEAGSFSRAAAALHLTQPSLSRQVQLLEDELGQRLLERTGRGAVPTEAGSALLAHARSIFELAERARVDMQERQRNPRGRITVGLPPRVAHVITADLVERFHAAYPEAAITVVEGLSIRLREWLVAGRVDVAIVFDPPRGLTAEDLDRPLRLSVGACFHTAVPIGVAAIFKVVFGETTMIGSDIDTVGKRNQTHPRHGFFSGVMFHKFLHESFGGFF